MTARGYQYEFGTALAVRGPLNGRKENRFHAAYPIPRAVGPNGGKSHLALESDQFAHVANTGGSGMVKRTMKRSASQGALT